MVKYYWIFGGIAGLSSVALEYLLFSGYLGYEHTYGVVLGKFLSMLVCLVFCVILIKKLKGRISFLRTSFTGLMLALICSAISGIGYSWMYAPNGEFFQPTKDHVLEGWKKENANKPDELMKIDEVKTKINERFSLKNHTYFDLAGYLVCGLFFSALLAAFVADRSSLTG
ncbi:MAG: DUF4199 family protein [Bacteroidetes bacterium]|nr:DUF4199 family protein [Bacteroidota bacterium]